jgi:hypothetical protein
MWVFDNNPTIISGLFLHILYKERYSSLFDNVVFAIINDHNSVGMYEIFKSQL